jgi:hypothetical protein
MKTLVRILAIAVVATAFLAINQRRQISAARSEVARLEPSAAVQSPKPSLATTRSATTAGEIARLRIENRDIHKLRGQISPAREKRKAIERMQTENAQMREKIDKLKANPNATIVQPFPLSNKGQATPETAIETMFWSMYQGDIETLSRVMPMMQELETIPPEERTNKVTLLRAMAGTIGKLEILERKFDSPDVAHLSARITPREGLGRGSPFGGEEKTFVLLRTNDLWQIIRER